MAFTKSLRKSFLGLLAFVIVLLYVLGAVDLITIPGIVTLALFLALGRSPCSASWRSGGGWESRGTLLW